jgi:hypothetical protein
MFFFISILFSGVIVRADLRGGAVPVGQGSG